MTLAAAMMSSERPDWNTPANVLELVRKVDKIGLDPCHNENSIVNPTVYFTEATNGLSRPWRAVGLVFCNPPYGRTIGDWASKCAYEGSHGQELIALVPARTDAKWFRSIWTANAICFWHGRLRFLGAPSSAPFPSAVAYWGERMERFYQAFGRAGRVVCP